MTLAGVPLPAPFTAQTCKMNQIIAVFFILSIERFSFIWNKNANNLMTCLKLICSDDKVVDMKKKFPIIVCNV